MGVDKKKEPQSAGVDYIREGFEKTRRITKSDETDEKNKAFIIRLRITGKQFSCSILSNGSNT